MKRICLVAAAVGVMMMSACAMTLPNGEEWMGPDRQYESGVPGEETKTAGTLLAIGKSSIAKMRKECPGYPELVSSGLFSPPPFQVAATLLHEHYGILVWEDYPISDTSDPHNLDFTRQMRYRWIFNPDINLLARESWATINTTYINKKAAGVQVLRAEVQSVDRNPMHVEFFTVKSDSQWKKQVMDIAQQGRARKAAGGGAYPDFTDLLPSCISYADTERGIYKYMSDLVFLNKLKEVLPIVVREIKQPKPMATGGGQPCVTDECQRAQTAVSQDAARIQRNIDNLLASQGTSRAKLQEQAKAVAEPKPAADVYVKRHRSDQWMDSTGVLTSGAYKNGWIYYTCPAELLGCANGFIKGFSELSLPEVQEKMQ